jgi:hypothetical protein
MNMSVQGRVDGHARLHGRVSVTAEDSKVRLHGDIGRDDEWILSGARDILSGAEN